MVRVRLSLLVSAIASVLSLSTVHAAPPESASIEEAPAVAHEPDPLLEEWESRGSTARTEQEAAWEAERASERAAQLQAIADREAAIDPAELERQRELEAKRSELQHLTSEMEGQIDRRGPTLVGVGLGSAALGIGIGAAIMGLGNVEFTGDGFSSPPGIAAVSIAGAGVLVYLTAGLAGHAIQARNRRIRDSYEPRRRALLDQIKPLSAPLTLTPVVTRGYQGLALAWRF